MSFLFFRSRPLARRMLLAAFALGPVSLHAAPVVTLPELDVDAADTPPLLDRTENANAVSGRMLRQRALSSPDSADLLSRLPGVSLYGAGGISSLPVINGMADDRVATSVDGVRIPPACPNHMNPAMSYISPDMVTEATAVAGITPVSMGGDSIAGTISVERKDPRFARRGKILFTGWARGAYHSNGNGWEGGLSSTVAGDWWSLNYSASYAERGDYHAGGSGGRVLSSSYKTYSHSVTAGFHKDNHLLALTFAQTDTPYEGFPNQYMDMTNNRSSSVNGKYSGAFDWGTLDVRGYWQRVNHAMNMLDDKGGHTATTGMPMNDDSRSAGYNIKATIPLGARNTLRLGNSFDHQGLNDWWPPLAGSMMMGPDTYHNINGGVRDRLGDYAEWESRITPSFHTLLGFRNDLVMMNTGSVSPYAWASGMSSMGGMSGMGGMAGMAATDSAAANAFNAQNHRHTDINFDVTALAHWDATRNVSIEGGYARKTRSPNFFERYAWGQSQMASQMIGWFGDGNGYVGNNNLSPEIANTASLTADFHDDARKLWNVKIQPYYTYVHHYVNVTRLKVFSDGFDQLKFVNHNAQIYGINSSASYQAWSAPQWGTGVFSAKLDWVRGQDLQTHTGLYHQMPTNGFIALDETYGDFTGRAEIQLVKRKSSVDALRSEPRTPGYALLNLTAGYKWRMMRFELGLDNVLNQRAYQPLGGYALGNYKADGDLMPVAVMGRSVNASIMASF
ncbi:TonB-dependent receptor plug domain-containing protein [Acetobacteraceae bacterium LMG 32668]|uniref:TonB-dependent receptor plug domain-containing protein n=2 Tax=Brytella acorum TaxID=2959299 RepID=A0AA35UGS7_9PROT|nr:TonB-dependent receptor [Brytella acorum]MDF3625118.1 TonB-dependent receptor plug domain-containing protein [Brytella acorum]CAI9121003.1 TonB-dependent receptor plug domain-containing protein [Brytella acorum]